MSFNKKSNEMYKKTTLDKKHNEKVSLFDNKENIINDLNR